MLSLSIALRYLASKKSHSAVNIISAISVAGVAVATAAIVIVLSVFNGFTQLAFDRLSSIDPDLKVVPIEGKTLSMADSLTNVISEIPGVKSATPVIEERGFLISDGNQMPVRFWGVMPQYFSTLRPMVIDSLRDYYGYDTISEFPRAYTSVGVAMSAMARPGAVFDIYVPKRIGRINPANPQSAFFGSKLEVKGVFRVEQPEYDKDLVIIPFDEARSILQYNREASSLHISLDPHASIQQIAEAVSSIVPEARVLTRHQQEETSFKMIKIEKWITFLMLAFILIIASFNIISTLSLMVIEKQSCMSTLRAMGAKRSLVKSIFMWQGFIISMIGGFAGVVLGAILSLAQQYGQFIKLAGDPNNLSITAYPVKVDQVDIFVVLVLVAIVALCASTITLLMNKKTEIQ